MGADFVVKACGRLGGGGHTLTIAGYSRGAYAAIRVAQALGKAGLSVDNLILLDAVKVTNAETEGEVARVIDRFDDSFDIEAEAQALLRTRRAGDIRVARETVARRHGRMLQAETYRADASAKALGSWNAVDDIGYFVVPRNVRLAVSYQRSPSVQSRDWTMGAAPVTLQGGGNRSISHPYFLTHSGMGGMPFRGDLPTKASSRLKEWQEARRLALDLARLATGLTAFQSFKHTVLNDIDPPKSWLMSPFIRSQYEIYQKDFGADQFDNL